MPMPAAELKSLIQEAFPDADIEIRALASDGDHYAASIVSARFRGKNRVQQHQMVYEALKGSRWLRTASMGNELHAEGIPCLADGRARLRIAK